MEMQLAKQTLNDFEDSDESCEREKQPLQQPLRSNGVACHAATGSSQGRGSGKWGNSVKDSVGSSKRSRNAAKEVTTSNFGAQKDDHTYRWVFLFLFGKCIVLVELTAH